MDHFAADDVPRAHQLREGASEVQEKNHIVISGYTKKTTPLIKELVEALSEDKKLNILISGLKFFISSILSKSKISEIIPKQTFA